MSNIDKHAVQAVADLKAGYTLGHADVAILNELARIALASLEAKPVSVNDDMAYAFHHAISDSSLGSDEVEEIKAGLRAAFANVTVPPAPVSAPKVPNSVTAETCSLDELGHDWNDAEYYAQGWNACRAAMLQGAEHKRHDAIDKNLIEALRLVQSMLDDYRERNYGDAERWIRHINTHMSDYSEAHGDDAYSVLHDLLPAAPQQEVK